jgi:hypothetical protein
MRSLKAGFYKAAFSGKPAYQELLDVFLNGGCGPDQMVYWSMGGFCLGQGDRGRGH